MRKIALLDRDTAATMKTAIRRSKGDAQGIETDVSLVTARFDEPLDRKLFQFRDPRIFKDGF